MINLLKEYVSYRQVNLMDEGRGVCENVFKEGTFVLPDVGQFKDIIEEASRVDESYEPSMADKEELSEEEKFENMKGGMEGSRWFDKEYVLPDYVGRPVGEMRVPFGVKRRLREIEFLRDEKRREAEKVADAVEVEEAEAAVVTAEEIAALEEDAKVDEEEEQEEEESESAK